MFSFRGFLSFDRNNLSSCTFLSCRFAPFDSFRHILDTFQAWLFVLYCFWVGFLESFMLFLSRSVLWSSTILIVSDCSFPFKGLILPKRFDVMPPFVFLCHTLCPMLPYGISPGFNTGSYSRPLAGHCSKLVILQCLLSYALCTSTSFFP